MCPPYFHHNGFVATHVLRHMMYLYELLVTMNKKVLNVPSKRYNINGHKYFTTQRMLKSHRNKMGLIYR